MIEELKKLVSIESVARPGEGGLPYGAGPAAALEYVLSLCESFGFRTKNADGLYGFAEIGSGEELIGILCHLDVVPAGKGWDYPPFEGTLDGDRLYGRGVIDDKGPAIASIFAMKDLLDSGRPLNKRIRIVFGQTEENGDWTDMEAYKAAEELPAYGFTPDGDFPAIYGEKGIMLVTVSMDKAASGILSIKGGSAPNMVPDFCTAVTPAGTFETSGKSSHGCAPWLGENAIGKMMERLCKENSCRENAHREKSCKENADVPFARMYMEKIGDSVHGERMNCAFEDEESGRLSMNAGMVKDEGCKLTLYLDIRYPVTCKPDKIMEVIEEELSPYKTEVKLIHHQDPVYMDKDGPVMRRLLDAYRSVTGDMTEPLVIGGGTYARSMANIIAFGPNLPGRPCTEHEKNEYIFIDDLRTIREVYKRALEALAYEQI